MSFLGRFSDLFRTGPADPEGWQTGDWAECVIFGQWINVPQGTPGAGPRHGQTMRVTEVKVVHDPRVPGGRVLTLAFAGWPDSYFEAAKFRKLRPRAEEIEAAEAEFTQLLRRKQTHAPAPAFAPGEPGEKIEEFQ